MNRLVLLAALFVPGCTAASTSVEPPEPAVRPVVEGDPLQGRWTIAEVNGQPATGLWLDLGGEGVGTVTRLSDGGIAFGSPEPRTSAYLGCNTFHPNGWTRNGDKMMLATEGALMTERGCDPSRLATETRAREILGKPMTMELIPPDRLRLINEAGALELVRQHGGR